MSRRTALVLLVLVLTGAALAAADERPVRIHLTISERAELQTLTRVVSIDAVRGLEVWAYASPKQLAALAKAGYTWQEAPEERNAELLAACPAGWDTNPNRSWDCYPTYPQYVGFLQYETNNHPSIARLVDLGATTNTVRPHRLYAVKLTDNPDLDEDEPEVLYTSSMHGDETVGWMLMLRLDRRAPHRLRHRPRADRHGRRAGDLDQPAGQPGRHLLRQRQRVSGATARTPTPTAATDRRQPQLPRPRRRPAPGRQRLAGPRPCT